jgi:hypothetical protein
LAQTSLNAEGHRVFESFTQSVTLETVFRQAGENPEQKKFRDALLRLRTYSTTEEDFNLFSARFWDVLSLEERAEFDDIIHLLPTRALVPEFNCCHLELVQSLECTAKQSTITKRHKRQNLMMQMG